MTSSENSFDVVGDLIIVEALVTGPRRAALGRFVLDTGAAVTTMTPDFADAVGYSARDAIRRSRVHSAIGSEDGYLLRVGALAALGIITREAPVNVFDLGYGEIEGLLGMSFLGELDFEINSTERVIRVGSDARLRAAHARTSRALDEALAALKRERERADALEERSGVLRRKLEAARRSVSFRLGRATRAAIDGRDPRRWLATWRGDDEILGELDDVPAPLDEAPSAGLPGPSTSSALATLDTLTPHGWRDTLERDPPTLVLVRGEALAIGTPWGDWGTPGGHDGVALLGELVTWCRARRIPVAYWGAQPAPRLAFDLIV